MVTATCHRKPILAVFAFVSAFFVVAHPAFSQEGKDAGYLVSELLSENNFRGLRHYRGLTSKLEGYASYVHGKRSFIVPSLQVVLPLQGERDGVEPLELNGSAEYMIEAGPGNVSAGAAFFTYPSEDTPVPGNTADIFLRLAFDAVALPTFELRQDLYKTRDRYFEMSFAQPVEKSLPLLGELLIIPQVKLGYNFGGSDAGYGADGIAFYQLGLRFLPHERVQNLFAQIWYQIGRDKNVQENAIFSVGYEWRLF